MSVNKESSAVCLEDFANMAGFPVDLVKKELFSNNQESDTISLDDLRAAMLNYLDSTMMAQEEPKLS